jgi:hypothetical protein
MEHHIGNGICVCIKKVISLEYNKTMEKYFDDSYRKKHKKNIVNYFYHKIDESSYPNHICAFVIKMVHFITPFLSYVVYAFAPLWLAMFTLVGSILSWLLFIYFKGCFVSNIEYKLDSNNFVNIIDPYLVILGYPVNPETRYDGTVYLVMLYFMTSFILLYIRLKMRNFTKN